MRKKHFYLRHNTRVCKRQGCVDAPLLLLRALSSHSKWALKWQPLNSKLSVLYCFNFVISISRHLLVFAKIRLSKVHYKMTAPNPEMKTTRPQFSRCQKIIRLSSNRRSGVSDTMTKSLTRVIHAICNLTVDIL